MPEFTYILGISVYYHDSAATLIKNGVVVPVVHCRVADLLALWSV